MVIGITGGIGSGKSTVCSIFDLFGIPVYNSDVRAKELMNSNPNLIQSIQANFGTEVYVDGNVNPTVLARKVFSDSAALKQLNALVHPVVSRDFDEWRDQFEKTHVVKEAAILIESGAYKQCDRIIVVEAPESLRIKRVMVRDGVAEEDVEARIRNQMSETERRVHADYIIDNSGKTMLIPQVQEILDRFKST